MEREEAINNLKKALGFSPTYDEAFYTLFPEFKEESEDERIRKALVRLLKVAGEAYLIDATGFNREQFLAYLEKQKQSLHISETCKENPDSFTDEDERTRKGIVNFLLYKAGHLLDEETEHKFIAYLEKQKPVEWNDTDMKEARDNLISVCRDWERGEPTTLIPIVAVRARYFLEHLTEPKPAEWREED